MLSSFLSRAAVMAIATTHLAATLVNAEGTWFSHLKDCPQTCSSSDVSSGNWTVYHNTKKLVRCMEPMLLDFAIQIPIDDPTKRLSLFACAGPGTGDDTTCLLGSESMAEVQSAWSGSNDGVGLGAVIQAARHTVSHLSKLDCSTTEPTTTFGYMNGSFVGVYSGGQMHNQGAIDLVQQFIDGIQKNGPNGDFQMMQICGSNRTSDYVVGIAAANPSTPGNISALAAVQNAVVTWSKGQCVTAFDSSSTANIKVWEQNSVDFSTQQNVTARGELVARTDCTTIKVVAGDSCATLAKRCGITAGALTKDNPSSTLCSSLTVGESVCCSAGTLPNVKPIPNPDGSCASYLVKSGDYCASIAASYQLTTANLESFNKNTWGWEGCTDLQLSMNICLSTGDPPLPAPIANTICGPQVPGTIRPTDGTAFAKLNPCKLNACCDIWGQCGTDHDFCTATKSTTGAPGTAAAGTNGCISNCGTAIVKGTAPSSFMTLGYFESFNAGRPCLNMDVRTLAGYSYTVVHFAFANVTEDFKVDVSAVQVSFNHFKAMTGFKKIISFGGWSFSTSLDSYPIFRSAVTPAQRQTFAENVATFVKDNGLDGADFDWEYPGAPDIPGIPSGSPSDGPNYLEFIKTLKTLMPSGTTVSIAAPASFWYLQGFPIKEMANVLDYIVYMTYDLHGQWDYGSAWSNPGCDNGNCLRSHINSTETQLALAMITKAGVDSGKVVVGVASYGRSFQMTHNTCTGPECTFTGPLSGATPGKCTGTAGYISNAELNDIVGLAASSNQAVNIWHDDSSDSDMMTYGSNWVSYMSDKTMASRVLTYKGNNFGGSTNWAIDLAQFNTAYDASNPSSKDVDWRHTYNCNDATDINQDQALLWDSLGCDEAWAAGIAYWKQPGHQKREFSEELAQFYNATNLKLTMDCGAMNTDNGCGGASVSCGNGVSPAGYIILSSMANLDAQYWQLYNSIIDATEDTWEDAANIASTFDPPPPSDAIASFIIGQMQNLWSMALSPGLGKVLTSAMGKEAAEDPLDTLSSLSDSGFGQINDALSTNNPIDPTADLQAQLKAMANMWLLGIVGISDGTFNGSDSSVANLYKLINKGAFAISHGENAYDMRNNTEAAIYAKLIPMTWSYDNGNPTDNPSGVFIVDSATACQAGDACPTQVPGSPGKGKPGYVEADAAQKTCHCYQGNMYYLVQLWGDAHNCDLNPDSGQMICTNTAFTTPRGFDALDGASWGGLTLSKFVEGSVNSYIYNDNKNGYVPDFTNTATVGLLISDNVLAPGGIVIPICSALEAWNNWDAINNDTGGSMTPNYPCN